MLTDPRLTTVVDDVLDFARDDWVGLWVILGWVKERMSGADSDEQKAATLAVCAAVLGHGLQAGDPPYTPGGFRKRHHAINDNGSCELSSRGRRKLHHRPTGLNR